MAEVILGKGLHAIRDGRCLAILRNTVELCTTPFQVAYEYGRRGEIFPVTSKQRHSSVWGVVGWLLFCGCFLLPWLLL